MTFIIPVASQRGKVNVKPTDELRQRINSEERRDKRERQARKNIELAKKWLTK